MIPLVARRKLAEYVDVFCERGAFTLDQSERIMAAARAHGMDTRACVPVHAFIAAWITQALTGIIRSHGLRC